MILVLDLGTTYFKASLFDGEGELLALARVPAPAVKSSAGHSEIDPRGFQNTIVSLVRELTAKVPDAVRSISAVTFATQTNSFVLLDTADTPLSPIVLWNDTRAAGFAPRVAEISAASGFYESTGVPALSHEFMAAKLLWFRAHEPDTFARAQRLCLISDYLTLWLTGQHVTEAGAAGLTGLLDIHTFEWREEFCRALTVPEPWLPTPVRAGTELGPLLPEPAEALGLSRRCRYIVGCLDQYAGAIGVGNVIPGRVSETTGTVLATVRCARGFSRDAPRTVFQGPAFDPRVYYQMVFAGISANLLEAYRNALPDRPTFRSLDEAAARIPPGANGLCLPTGAPDEIERIVSTEWPARYGRGQATRAILEGVAAALATQIRELCGSDLPPAVRCAGGAARSELWREIKSGILGIPVHAALCPEPTSLGAAMLTQRALTGEDLPSLASRWGRRGHDSLTS